MSGDVNPPVGSRGKAVGGVVTQKLNLFVNECLNFDVLGKISKTAKNTIIEKLGSAKGDGAGANLPCPCIHVSAVKFIHTEAVVYN